MRPAFFGLAFAGLVFLLRSAAPAADQAEPQFETIALGGPRGTSVTIEPREGTFIVTVEMKPVSCFDEATNAAVNRAKAECFALNGFCRSSFGKAKRLTNDTLTSENSDAIFQGVKIQSAGFQGGRYRLQLSMPEDGIRPPPGKPSAPKKLDRTSPLFTRYGDHEATIDALHRTLNAELAKVVDDLAAVKAEQPVIVKAAEAVRAAGLSRFATLRHVIQTDNLLLDTTERPELLDKEDVARKDWEKRVDGCIQALAVQK